MEGASRRKLGDGPEPAAPVSYTHLDVYKRQVPDDIHRTAALVAHVFGLAEVDERRSTGLVFVVFSDCLLYTSRCV